jgi:hypothetical protein
MKFRLTRILLGIIAVSSLSGCVVYGPRPRAVYYAEPGYVVYDEPTVVYVHGGYGGYYHHGYRR